LLLNRRATIMAMGVDCRNEIRRLRTKSAPAASSIWQFALADWPTDLLSVNAVMAAIGRFQKGDEIFYAKAVDGDLYRLRGDVFGSPTFDKKPTPGKGLKILTPVNPSKIIAIGLNYADHAREQNKPLPKEPLLWLKAPTSLLPDGGKIEIPFPQHRTDYEAELAIVIGRRVRNVTPAAAARYILGYTAALDITDRTIQNSESQYARSKSYDTFTPLGPYVETKLDPDDLTIQLFQNGQLRQNSNTSQLIFKCPALVSFVSTNMTLLPGDVIVTGTPSGVGPIQSGDRLEVRIQGLTPLVNSVK
jgi:2-keto-4-pentenoate hydratase/2-oxohepta-3-ene-1,7-dioic acid hydratase in catechol pathway